MDRRDAAVFLTGAGFAGVAAYLYLKYNKNQDTDQPCRETISPNHENWSSNSQLDNHSRANNSTVEGDYREDDVDSGLYLETGGPTQGSGESLQLDAVPFSTDNTGSSDDRPTQQSDDRSHTAQPCRQTNSPNHENWSSNSQFDNHSRENNSTVEGDNRENDVDSGLYLETDGTIQGSEGESLQIDAVSFFSDNTGTSDERTTQQTDARSRYEYDAVIVYAEGDERIAKECFRRLKSCGKIAFPDDLMLIGTLITDGLANLLDRCRLMIIIHTENFKTDGLAEFTKHTNLIQSLENVDVDKRNRIIPVSADDTKMCETLTSFQSLMFDDDFFIEKMSKTFRFWRVQLP